MNAAASPRLCTRCRTRPAGLPRAPIPGPLGERARANLCPDCWSEWERMEVMVINELHLNLLDPEAPAILARHMAEYLGLGDAPGEGAAAEGEDHPDPSQR